MPFAKRFTNGLKVGAPLPVTVNHAEVDACRLQSAKGIGVTLMNGSGKPLESLRVAVPTISRCRKVSLAIGAVPKITIHGDGATVVMPLKDGDLLMLVR